MYRAIQGNFILLQEFIQKFWTIVAPSQIEWFETCKESVDFIIQTDLIFYNVFFISYLLNSLPLVIH